MFEKLTTLEEIFSFKLGSALSMEKEMLDKLQQETRREELRALAGGLNQGSRCSDRPAWVAIKGLPPGVGYGG